MRKDTKIFISIFAAIFLVTLTAIGLIGGLIYLYSKRPIPIPPITTDNDDTKVFSFEKFKSEAELKAYLQEASVNNSYYRNDMRMKQDITNDMAITAPGAAESGIPTERYSDTNVQVTGIDEPDIVKTDGQNIYLSKEEWLYYPSTREPQILERQISPVGQKIIAPVALPPINNEQVEIIKALPAETMQAISKINFNGDLLLSGNILIIINNSNGIEAYDLTDSKNPQKLWDLKYENNNYFVNARLTKGKLYLVLNSYLDQNLPCPIHPVLYNQKAFEIPCTDIYRPSDIGSSNLTNILKIDTKSGQIETKLSYMGDSYQNIFYMSQSNIYLTYPIQLKEYDFIVGFIKSYGSKFIPQEDINRVLEIDSYNISSDSKLNEIMAVLDKYQYIDGEENKVLQEAATKYYESIKRQIEETNVIKVSIDNLEITSKGKFPGYLLNQFSLDEYNGNLRVATTTGDSWLMGMSTEKSTNDVYVLDSNLNITGSVLDMGRGERIYSVRFIEDKAYLVTFRQTDPFYVLDLKDPSDPQLKGELKIPGYSAYLHQLDTNLILGVGKEDSNVKLSLFDVSNPQNPIEVSKFSIKNSFWTEVEGNHHAFMMDAKHKIFFIPAEEKGYIFSYSDNTLKEVKTIEKINAKRALYINDTLFIIGNDNIVAIDQNTWELKNTFKL